MQILRVTADHEGHLRVEESGGDALEVDWGFILPQIIQESERRHYFYFCLSRTEED
jgi:hypothetical protein